MMPLFMARARGPEHGRLRTESQILELTISLESMDGLTAYPHNDVI